VRVDSEDVGTGKHTHTCTAYFTMVALDADEKALPLPPVTPDTPADQRRHREANLRREVRLAEPGELRRVPDPGQPR
jgi:acyl-CoA hydrolase